MITEHLVYRYPESQRHTFLGTNILFHFFLLGHGLDSLIIGRNVFLGTLKRYFDGVLLADQLICSKCKLETHKVTFLIFLETLNFTWVF